MVNKKHFNWDIYAINFNQMGFLTKIKKKNKMEKQEVIDILTQFNLWRKGELKDYPVSPSVLGVAIEWAIKYLEEAK